MKPFKNCPYLKIEEAEEMIEREKQVLFYMKSETMKCKKALQKADIEILYKLEKTYYDGFLWSDTVSDNRRLEIPLAIEKLRTKQEIPKKCSACPYVERNCQELLDLRKSCAGFLRKKIMQATSYYNEMMGLLQAILNSHIKYASSRENFLITFYEDMRLSLVLFNIEHFKPAESGHYVAYLCYQDEKTLEIREECIEYEYQVTSKVLVGTYLRDTNQAFKFIKVYLPKERIKGFEESIMAAINVLIKKLNIRFGRSYGQIQGVYIELASYSSDYQIKLIRLLASLNYKVLGKMNSQGIFEERNLLVYLCKLKKMP